LALRSSGCGTSWPNAAAPAYAVVDSLPIDRCHSARIHRVKRFRRIADIGYCASKKIAFDGVKLHLQVTDQGLPMGYVVTKAFVTTGWPLKPL